MSQPMTREQVRAWHERWQRINEAEREELRRTPVHQKLRQLATMMAAARELGWDEQLAAEEAQVRNRWILLKRRAVGG